MSFGVMACSRARYENSPVTNFPGLEPETSDEVSLSEDTADLTNPAGIVGQSAALRSVLQLVDMVAGSDATVLLLGETGTGKELIAKAIHERSTRRKEGFITLNCAAIPSALFESELFGHERGAFTGAHIQRVGRLELADRGTMFLDEVGEMPLELQPKLLRALQERAYERVGSARTKNVDMRLIAATNCDLEEMVDEKQFRADLYYRLNVFPIRIPPVRYDHDNIAGENNISPRVGFAFLPLVDGRTIIRGGIGIFYDDINLNVATFDQLQNRILTYFGAEGSLPVSTLQRFEFTGDRLRTPRSINWNIQLDREWLKNLFVRVGYQQRQARREFILNPVESDSTTVLGLDNSGSSRYRELEVTVRYRFRERDEFTASYVRSSARGDLNDFNSYFGNFENPIIQANERTRLPWDAPNRFLFWGEFHVKYGITLAPVLDIRTGFPYSIIDEDRDFVGPRNLAGRYPRFTSVDLQILKSVSLPGRFTKYRVELGLKVFNLTNHFNPRDFQNNLASDSFGGFYNGVGRKYGTRITFVKK